VSATKKETRIMDKRRWFLIGAAFFCCLAALARTNEVVKEKRPADSGIIIVRPPEPKIEEKGKGPDARPAPPADDARGIPPVGAIIAWAKSLPGTPSLPGEWVECNGQTLKLPGSYYDGQELPNLNGADEKPQRFLRGAMESGAVGGSDKHVHNRQLVQRTGNARVNVASRSPKAHLPPYYEVTWIIRVR
jgi:hypothetical protein